MNKKGFKSLNRELEVEEEEEIQSEYNLEERIIDNSVCIFVLESIPLSTFLSS
jgi:hypothetical protein